MKYLTSHSTIACGQVKAMLDDCRNAMKELGLRTLRLEDEPTVICYEYYRSGKYIGLHEMTVLAIHLNTDDDLVLNVQPYSPTVKFVNETVTGPDCPVIDWNGDCEYFLSVQSDDVEYLSLLNLDDHICDAFNRYETEHGKGETFRILVLDFNTTSLDIVEADSDTIDETNIEEFLSTMYDLDSIAYMVCGDGPDEALVYGGHRMVSGDYFTALKGRINLTLSDDSETA